MEQEIFLAVCYHKEAERIETDLLRPVHVGRAGAAAPLPGMIGDDTGPNISARNAQWCELTALYWMWKNVSAQQYGLMHYRRLFNFRPGADSRSRNFETADAKAHRRFGWNDAAIRAACARADIILLEPRDVHPTGVPGMIQTNRQMYARDHHARDLDAAEAVIARDHPEYLPAFQQVMTATTLSYGNLMIMTAPHFQRYCAWLFDILEQLDAQGGREDYDAYQRRVWGFLSERLLNVYARHAADTLGARVGYLPLAKGLPPQLDLDGAEISRRATQELAKARPAADAAPLRLLLATPPDNPGQGAATLASVLRHRDPGTLDLWTLGTDAAFDAWTRTLGLTARPFDLPTDLRAALPGDLLNDPDALPLLAALACPAGSGPVLCLGPGRVAVQDPASLLRLAEPANVAACPDLGGVGHGRRLHMAPDRRYLDPGVAVVRPGTMDAAAMIRAIMHHYGQSRDVITRPGADLFNLVLGAEAQVLPLRWNAPEALYDKMRGDLPLPPEALIEEATHPAILALSDQTAAFADLRAEALRGTPWAPAGGLRRWIGGLLRR
ncbi:MAG: DUF4422 domain-containing protein [Rhodobacteraceae bacterium]|nr:DUF4422 domain-containing protein [Paracoccaceae bacterium]